MFSVVVNKSVEEYVNNEKILDVTNTHTQDISKWKTVLAIHDSERAEVFKF